MIENWLTGMYKQWWFDRLFFVILTLKATVYFDVGLKAFWQGTDRQRNLPSLPAAMPSRPLGQEVMAGYDITDS